MPDAASAAIRKLAVAGLTRSRMVHPAGSPARQPVACPAPVSSSVHGLDERSGAIRSSSGFPGESEPRATGNEAAA